ncbi:MAG TPA: winged helix-turn-helix domain-containing protein [archaeon]|nr:winged helix-turn-helix domain-containing protein [archaeon]
MDYFKSVSLKDLEKLYKKETDPKVKTKLLMVVHKKQGMKQIKIAKLTVTPQSTVSDQIDNFRKRGIAGLYRKLPDREYGYLGNSQKQKVIEYIENENPTSRQINQYIQDNFGKSYHPFSIPRLLRSLGFSRITPRKRHYKSDKSKQEEWKQVFKKKSKNTWIWVIESSSKTNQ